MPTTEIAKDMSRTEELPRTEASTAELSSVSRILIGTDFSDASQKALQRALAIARAYHAKIYIAHVVSSLGYTMNGPDVAASATELVTRDIHDLETRLAETGALDGIAHTTIVREGEIWEQLEHIIQEKHVDLVVVGTHGKTGVRKLLLGSVAQAVFRHATCPVLTVGPHVPLTSTHVKLRHILYPTDLSLDSAQAAGYAVSLAKEQGSRLTIVHVLERPGTAEVDKREEEFEQLLRRSLPGGLPKNCTFRVQLGSVDNTILELADEGRVDLIVLGLHPASARKHPHWPHAYEIAREAFCPVLTVRGNSKFKL